MAIKVYKDEAAGAIFIENANGVQFLNSLQATMDDPTDQIISVMDLSKGVEIFSGLSYTEFVDKNEDAYAADALGTCNALNAVFAAAGDDAGSAPVITSATTVNLTAGDTLNYELTATNGVGYEWSGLPSGLVTVDGNVRKLVGGSGLAVGTYPITAKAVNYFGEDSETINLVVSAPSYSNTKSVNLFNSEYMGANASLLDPILGRAANGAGAGDAWSLSIWYKGSTNNTGQTIFYFGDNDADNGGFVDLRQTSSGGQKRLRLRYGSNNNYLQFTTPNGSITPGTWQHILVTYDGGTTGSSSGSMSDYYSRFKIFIDGVQQTNTESHSNYGYTGGVDPDNLRVGRFTQSIHLRDARVDEVAIWGSDQSANIAAIYNTGSTHDLSLLTTAPDHWWRMGDGDTFPTIQDNVGTAHFVMYNSAASRIVTDAP